MTVTSRPELRSDSYNRSADPLAGGSALRIYYVHPLLFADASAEFSRIASLGFSHVLLAPPFLSGGAGDMFLTADHDRLHPALGAMSADSWLGDMAERARAHGIALLLDLVLDRLADGAVLLAGHADWGAHDDRGAPPDPRRTPEGRLVPLRYDRHPQELTAWWTARIAGWTTLGVRGFRCHAAQRIPPQVWRSLIGAARKMAGEAPPLFFAWTPGATEAQTRALGDCGFDFAASSSWAWDFRADWLDDDTRRMGAIAPLVAMPELPFGPRLAADAPGRVAAERALSVAAGFGAGWLMPMGFEFGATLPLDASAGDGRDWRRLMDAPAYDLSAAVRVANVLHTELAALPVARLITPPGAPVAVLLRSPAQPDGVGAALCINSRLDRPANVDPLPILAGSDGLHGLHDGAEDPGIATEVALPAGGTRTMSLRPQAPVRQAVALPGPVLREAERISIEMVTPMVRAARYPAKHRVGDSVQVAADIVGDGHDVLGVALRWREADATAWQERPMTPLGNDRYAADFPLIRLGRHEFAVEAWLDRFASFRDELSKKDAAGLSLTLELQEGRSLVEARAAANPALAALAARLTDASPEAVRDALLDTGTAALMRAADPRPFRTRTPPVPVDAERRAAGFASWYELFPRSQTDRPERHGTFRDVIARLPALHDMGFDVLYFPPIHPIGRTHRKGRNNALTAGAQDPGSPYAIGSAEGGHDAIHPELGTIEDFRALSRAAAAYGIELALDFAIQCSPDHPWLREHPEWFAWRPDGTIRYAENPPKKYEDIVNVDFYAEGANPSLWIALRDVVLFWVREGVRIFRVDNPHTKPFPFWEWLIGDIRGQYPDVIFLAEAFTRPKVMYRLACVGFSQSYTYFTWRDTAAEFRAYLTELTQEAPREFFRPNFFVNTPDINPVFLQRSGRAGFLIRAALATMLAGVWGMYSGFELCESEPISGREEYLDSEKYEIRVRDWTQPGNIIAEITRLNAIRRSNPALQTHLGVTFLPCTDDAILSFAKITPSGDNIVVVAIGMDPHAARTGRMSLAPAIRAAAGDGPLHLEELMTGQTEIWHGDEHEITLDPANRIFSVWRVQTAFERAP